MVLSLTAEELCKDFVPEDFHVAVRFVSGDCSPNKPAIDNFELLFREIVVVSSLTMNAAKTLHLCIGRQGIKRNEKENRNNMVVSR